MAQPEGVQGVPVSKEDRDFNPIQKNAEIGSEN